MGNNCCKSKSTISSIPKKSSPSSSNESTLSRITFSNSLNDDNKGKGQLKKISIIGQIYGVDKPPHRIEPKEEAKTEEKLGKFSVQKQLTDVKKEETHTTLHESDVKKETEISAIV